MKNNLKYTAAIVFTISMAGISGCTSNTADNKATTTSVTQSDTTAVVSDEKDTSAVNDTSALADTTAAKTNKIATVKKVLHVPLTLIINNLTSATAPVVVGLYGTENKFPDPKDQLKEYKFIPHGNTLIAKIPNLKFGQYAIALYQDVNSNGKIDKNFIGIPTEPYAFSNNYKPTIKAPGFNNCKFEYDVDANTITMNMIK